jgi:tetrahydromethanopterin S-methyltransferase subunit B
MKNDIKIKGHNRLIKRNGSIIDTDNSSYEAAKARLHKQREIDNAISDVFNLNEKFNHLETKVNDLDNKLDSILNLLKEKIL